MKILIIDPHYPNFLKQVYERNPGLEKQSYEVQKKKIFDCMFGTSNFYSTHLKELGHEADEIIPNCEPLQKAWAREHHISYKKNYFSKIPKLKKLLTTDWEERILEAQLREYSPDVLYCQELLIPSKAALERSGIKPKLIVGQIASPIDFNPDVLGYYDLILTSFPHFVERFRKIGIASEYFKIGFEPNILSKLDKNAEQNTKKYNAVFVGGISRFHTSALATLEYAATHGPVDFWGYGSNKIPETSPIRARHHGMAWGLDMFSILHNAKISINRHIDVAENYANNMRLYEATGVGSLLLTDAKDNISDLFKPGEEMVTYSSKEDLVEKIHYYLSHEEERSRIAAAGQARTLRDHTYAVRMKELIGILEKYLNK